MELSGWGRYPRIDAQLIEPVNTADIRWHLQQCPDRAYIARGGGRSYGDSALSAHVISSRYLDHFIEFDNNKLTLHCAAGVNLGHIQQLIVPHGAFLPVLPGTQFVSLGGAIAADIHGKNHHQDGSFCDHVEHLSLQLASGEVLRCSRDENAALFAATCGGMGLTGIIIDACIRLQPVAGPGINSRAIIAANLDDCLNKLEQHRHSQYLVAWVDCLARGAKLGRGIVYLGEHAKAGKHPAIVDHRIRLAVPFSVPGFLLNRYSMGMFNHLYYVLKQRRTQEVLVDYRRYFFPLDRIRNWNRLYGSRGFIQYQLLLPGPSARRGLQAVLERVSEAGQGSFLSVLKQFGPANNNPLSFPGEGFTLSLDFKNHPALSALLDSLDAIIKEHGGRLYLAKDARMSASMFRAGYPEWEQFMQVKQQVDPDNRFSSLQARRLGLIPGQA